MRSEYHCSHMIEDVASKWGDSNEQFMNRDLGLQAKFSLVGLSQLYLKLSVLANPCVYIMKFRQTVVAISRAVLACLCLIGQV